MAHHGAHGDHRENPLKKLGVLSALRGEGVLVQPFGHSQRREGVANFADTPHNVTRRYTQGATMFRILRTSRQGKIAKLCHVTI
jgi:hypothetical protein